jgi:hypothetical protein
VAESIYVRNKARRRVIASYGKESQRSAARKVPRHGDFAYWNGLLVSSVDLTVGLRATPKWFQVDKGYANLPQLLKIDLDQEPDNSTTGRKNE